jgi:uncharacterized protein
MSLRRLLLLLWALAAAAFVTWSALHTFHVGRMVLPSSQSIAVALAITAVCSLVLCWLWMALWIVIRRFSRSTSWVDRPAARALLLLLLLISAGLVLYGRFVEPRWIALREVSLGGAPPAGEAPVRVAVISDLHIEPAGEPWTALPGIVNGTDPDLILFLGDPLNRPRALPHLKRVLGAMRARHGKFAVRGNWDVWYWYALPLLEGTGFTWIDGRSERLRVRGQTIFLVGFPFDDVDEDERANRLLGGLRGPGWRLLLYHTPDLVESVRGADLYLAGHTHGGQVALPLLGPFVTLSRYGNRYARGLKRVGPTWLYVNSGIGVERGIPVRLGVRPEVTLIKLGGKAGEGP